MYSNSLQNLVSKLYFLVLEMQRAVGNSCVFPTSRSAHSELTTVLGIPEKSHFQRNCCRSLNSSVIKMVLQSLGVRGCGYRVVRMTDPALGAQSARQPPPLGETWESLGSSESHGRFGAVSRCGEVWIAVFAPLGGPVPVRQEGLLLFGR